MSTIEYTTIDKSSCGPGPWQDEPDKIQYLDPETNYPCLIKRVDHSGHLCGYVGVEPSHPMYNKTYNDRETSNLEVHGGITYTDFCQEISLETFHHFQKRYLNLEKEALKYPIGDAANFRRKWEPYLNDFEKFKEKAQSEFICYIPEQNTPDNIWWFGFDCAHIGDICPISLHLEGEEYRTLEYVKEQIRNLARQLKELE